MIQQARRCFLPRAAAVCRKAGCGDRSGLHIWWLWEPAIAGVVKGVSACKHVALDFYGCNGRVGDGESARAALVAAALAAHAEVVDSWQRAQPIVGVIAVVATNEAHILLHAYPEYGYAALDLLFADQAFDAETCQSYLEEFFSPTAVVRRELFRGGDNHGSAYRQ